MPVPVILKESFDRFWDANNKRFDMAHASECGKYMEEAIPYVQNDAAIPAEIRRNVGFLRKNPGQTQYNGHSIDTFAYDLGGNLTHSVDVIANAEQKHPWNSEGGTNRPDPAKAFTEDTNTAYYTSKDWLSEPEGEAPDDMVPWIPYNEQGFQELKRQLAYDYARRPQGADFDVSVWAGRYFHNSYMGPDKTPLGETAGLDRAKREWCTALNVSFIYAPTDWKIGDPVP